MNRLKQIVLIFLTILNPIKTKAMHLFRTNPAYMAVAALIFLQIPILIAGNTTSPAASKYKSEFLLHLAATNIVKPEARSMEEMVMEQADSLYSTIGLEASGLDEEAFEMAYKGYFKLLQEGVISKPGILTIADFSKASDEKRLFVLDLENLKILFQTLVAHGRNSGLKYATDFSNRPESNKSSLGFYVTLNTYFGEHGLSLKLKGLERGINDNAYDRAIVVHGSQYVSPNISRSQGYIGRSLGCPALPMRESSKIIKSIKDGSLLFIYHPTKAYVEKSEILNS